MKRSLTACVCLLVASTATATLTDPTRPATFRTAPVAAPAAAPALRVEAIMRANDKLVAIVNGKLVRVGDRIGEALIKNIDAASVQYTLQGRTHIAKLPRADLKVRKNSSEVGS